MNRIGMPSERELEKIRKEGMEIAGVGLYRYGYDGRIVFMDHRTLEILEAVDIFPEPASLVDKDISEVINYTGSVTRIREQVKQYGRINNFEFELCSLKGNVKWILLNAYHVQDEENDEGYIQGFITDITEIKLSEEKMLHERNILRTLMDNLPDYIYFKDINANFVSLNIALMHVMGVDDLSDAIGKNDYEFFPHELASKFFADDMMVMKSGKSLRNRIERGYREDGSLIWVSTTKVPLKDSEGNVTGLVGVGHDITNRKEMEEELIKRKNQLELLNKELETFAYSVSHDLRAPLRGIDGFSQALLEDYYDGFDETGRDYISRVRKASQKMGYLIDDLLKLSRLSRAQINIQKINLSEIVAEICDDLLINDPERSVEIVIQPNVIAEADLQLIHVALSNLLGNAWKFTSKQKNANIEFGMKEQDGREIYYIKDDGAGFDMNYKDKLFGAFQRLHGFEDFSGSGIGLATVKRVIGRHGGEVWAVGEVGKGATFYFTI